MKRPEKEQLYGALGTIVFHVIVLIILLLVVMERPLQQEEVGVPVVMGNVNEASGDAFEYTEVKVAPQPSKIATDVPEPAPSIDEPLITQNDESTVEIPASEKEKNENKKPQKSAQELEKERLEREAEAKRQEAERIEREANAKIAGAFGKGSSMSSRGESEDKEGNEGSVEGNETTGAITGVGGYGAFDLSGRSLGEGGLPRPIYDVQDEGRVVVNITVNRDGLVIAASINHRTNTTNAKLRKAAMDAARKAVFNSVNTVDNQMGTITYYFKLR